MVLLGGFLLGCSPKKLGDGSPDSGVLTPPDLPPEEPPGGAGDDGIFRDGFETSAGVRRVLIVEDFECPAFAAEEVWSVIVAHDFVTEITDGGEVRETVRQITAAEYCGLAD